MRSGRKTRVEAKGDLIPGDSQFESGSTVAQDLPGKPSFTTTVYHPRVPEGTGAAYNVQTAEAWHSFSPFQKLPHSVRFSYFHHTRFGHLCLESTQQKSPFHTHMKILTSTYPKTKPNRDHDVTTHTDSSIITADADVMTWP